MKSSAFVTSALVVSIISLIVSIVSFIGTLVKVGIL